MNTAPAEVYGSHAASLQPPHQLLLTPSAVCLSCADGHPRLIQEFEREARTDGMPSRELADRKRKLVNQFNEYVNLKKQHSSTEAGRGELLAGAGAASGQDEAQAGGGSATDGEVQCTVIQGTAAAAQTGGEGPQPPTLRLLAC